MEPNFSISIWNMKKHGLRELNIIKDQFGSWVLFSFEFSKLREKYPYSEFFWPVFSPNVGKYGPEKLRISTPFTQRECPKDC